MTIQEETAFCILTPINLLLSLPVYAVFCTAQLWKTSNSQNTGARACYQDTWLGIGVWDKKRFSVSLSPHPDPGLGCYSVAHTNHRAPQLSREGVFHVCLSSLGLAPGGAAAPRLALRACSVLGGPPSWAWGCWCDPWSDPWSLGCPVILEEMKACRGSSPRRGRAGKQQSERYFWARTIGRQGT